MTLGAVCAFEELFADELRRPMVARLQRSHFSAWTKSGANNTATFALAYFNDYGAYDYNTPKIEFSERREVAHLYMANATM